MTYPKEGGEADREARRRRRLLWATALGLAGAVGCHQGLESTAGLPVPPAPESEAADTPRQPADAPRQTAETPTPAQRADAPRQPADTPRQPADAPRQTADAPRQTADAPRQTAETPTPAQRADAPRQPAEAPAAAVAPAAGRITDLAPTVVVVGFDGLTRDAAERLEMPRLRRFAAEGVRAGGLVPGFPSFSFVSFYSMATGLHPEHHGVIHNAIHDPATGETFNPYLSYKMPHWWGGEPFWVTAQLQGQRAATCFWVGSEAPIKKVLPAYGRAYADRLGAAERVDQLLAWFDLPAAERPTLLTLYFPEVDVAAHVHGVGSGAEAGAARAVDAEFGRFFDGLAARGIADQVNLLAVSDHGFVNVPENQLIPVDEIIDLARHRVLEFELHPATPIISVFPAEGEGEADEVYRQLAAAHPRLKVYRRAEIPERFHNRTHPRTPPLIGVAESGWMAYSAVQAERLKKAGRLPAGIFKGMHGYDPADPAMHGFFAARGPAFAPGRRVPAFENTAIYLLVTTLLGLQPAPNDADPEAVRVLLEKGAR